jgi:hypothetical protein
MRDEYHLVTARIFWASMRTADSKGLIAKKSSILMGDSCGEDVIDTLPKK